MSATTYRGYRVRAPRLFLREHLRSATKYRRASGYFSSGAFAAFPACFISFFERGGKVELVTGPELSKTDVVAIEDGLLTPTVGADPVSTLRRASRHSFGPALLSWAIARRQCHIKIATVQPGYSGIYHEKFGLIDGAHSLVAFEGSVNETAGGWHHNFERLRVVEEPNRLHELERDFERLWSNDTTGIIVQDVSQALANDIITIRRSSVIVQRPLDSSMRDQREVLRLPPRITLRDYQQEAIQHWLSSDGRGVLEMATATGKTITALATAVRVYEGLSGPLVVIIICPYIHLVDQWIRECRAFGLSPLRCAGPSGTWMDFANSGVYRVNTGTRRLLSLVATNATFSGNVFQSVLRRLRSRTILIADEVHNLGAAKLSAHLPENITLRMGLSATPTRWLDASGTDRLLRYFGRVVFQYDLKRALRSGDVLTPYRYFPVVVELEEDEQEEYLALTAALGRYMTGASLDDLSEPALALLIKRSRLVASARQKVHALREAITPYRTLPHSIVYCGDGTMELADTELGAEEPQGIRRQIDVVMRLLRSELGMGVARFTAETSSTNREAIRENFSRGDLNAIVAIRCLDEGVDIPEIQRAFILASSTNPRQFIQRRGRILRTAPGKEVAEIFDFLVMPPGSARTDASSSVGRRLLEREMKRVVEFCRLAMNGPEARRRLSPILREWDLIHL